MAAWTTTTGGSAGGRAGLAAAGRRAQRALVRRWRRTESAMFLVLTAVLVAMTALLVADPGYTLTILLVPLVLASLFLGPRQLSWFCVLDLTAVLASLVAARQAPGSISAVQAGSVLVMFVLGLIVLLSSFRRARLGVAGLRGESMLVDLRDRILSQGRLPALPPGWYAQSALRSAGGTPFAGDFVVASGGGAEGRLHVAMVDVSGKGEQAGTRALLLSGAFGGLLTALRPEHFLEAANDFLLRQGWDEGFASAVHVTLDLTTGEYDVRSAGHPPVAVYRAGSGRWAVLDAEGPLLGIVPGAAYEPVRGRLGPGDALMAYTDGLVEEPGRDLGLGIDRLLGTAEKRLQGTFDDAARRLVDELGSPQDDRALVVVHRRPGG